MYEKEDVDEAIDCAVEEHGGVPTFTEYRELDTDPHPSQLVFDRFYGGWNEVLLEFYGEIRFDPETVNGDYSDGGHYYGPDWYQIRPEIRALDDHECQRCGTTNEEHEAEYGSKLHVHHIRPFRFWDDHEQANREENLVSLCYQCHRQLEVYAAEEDVQSQIEQLDGDRWGVLA